MGFGLDTTALLAQIAANVEATERLATAIDRLAAATEQGNEQGKS